MSFLKNLFNTDGLVKVELYELPKNSRSKQTQVPDLLRSDDYRSGALQRSCQEALLRHLDQGKPLASMMSPKSTKAAANALLALSHPCLRHLDLFAYCIDLFDNGEGGLRLKGLYAQYLQDLMSYNPINLAKILKLHGDEYQFFQLTKPVHDQLAQFAILLDDPNLAQRLERLENCEDKKTRLFDHLQFHHFRRRLSNSHYIRDSALREFLTPGRDIDHQEIHCRIERFLGPLCELSAGDRTFSFIPKALIDQYWADGPSLESCAETFESEVTLDQIMAFPGIDQFLNDHSFHFLQELDISPVGGSAELGKDRLALISLMTQKALDAGHSTVDIHYTSIYEMSRYRLQDIRNQGRDMNKCWVKPALDLVANNNFSPAGLAIIKVLLIHEGVDKLLGFDLTDKQLLAAKELTGSGGFAQGLSPIARDEMMGRDLGL